MMFPFMYKSLYVYVYVYKKVCLTIYTEKKHASIKKHVDYEIKSFTLI